MATGKPEAVLDVIFDSKSFRFQKKRACGKRHIEKYKMKASVVVGNFLKARKNAIKGGPRGSAEEA